MEQQGAFETPWGRVVCEVGFAGICRIVLDGPPAPPLAGPLAVALHGYLHGVPLPDDLPVSLTGLSAFTRAVLLACRAIPYGETRSYGELAASLGRPTAARAVGGALGRNPVPLVIPCHRVVGHAGDLTGFTGGLHWKRALLTHEGSLPLSV